MKTKIRLARFGGKKSPFYRIVVVSSAAKRNGRFIEVIGSYDPSQGVEKAKVDRQKVNLWMTRGAQPTDIIRQIVKRAPA